MLNNLLDLNKTSFPISFFKEFILPTETMKEEIIELSRSTEEIELEKTILSINETDQGWRLIEIVKRYDTLVEKAAFLLIDSNSKKIFFNWETIKGISNHLPSISKNIYNKEIMISTIEDYEVHHIDELLRTVFESLSDISEKFIEKHLEEMLDIARKNIKQREIYTNTKITALKDEETLAYEAFLAGKETPVKYGSVLDLFNFSYISLGELTIESSIRTLQLLLDPQRFYETAIEEVEFNLADHRSLCYNALRAHHYNEKLIELQKKSDSDYEINYLKALHETTKNFKKTDKYTFFDVTINSDYDTKCLSTGPTRYLNQGRAGFINPLEITKVSYNDLILFNKVDFDKDFLGLDSVEPIKNSIPTELINQPNILPFKNSKKNKICEGQLALNLFN